MANATCYQYEYVVTDAVGNVHRATSANVAKVDYAGAVGANGALVSYWRMGESSSGGTTVVTSDTFNTGSAGALLTARSPEVGSWVHTAASGTTEVLSNAGRARRVGTNQAIDYMTPGPSSSDYSVSADVYRAGALNFDRVGIFARANATIDRYYLARYEKANNAWIIIKYEFGGTFTLGSNFPQTIADGVTVNAKLTVTGSNPTLLTLHINGGLAISTSDTVAISGTAELTAAGFGGIHDGSSSGNSPKSDTAGLHLDNFQVTQGGSAVATDSKGSNHGTYNGVPTVGIAGALFGDANTAVTLDGANDYIQSLTATSIPTGSAARTVEGWLKTTSATDQMLFGYGTMANTQQFALRLQANGIDLLAVGYGAGNDLTFTAPYTLKDGAWHHIAATYNDTAITVYVDGTAITAQNATRNTVVDAYGIQMGAVVTPGDPSTGKFLNGSLDEVAIYNTALDQTTITNHYQLALADGT